MKNNKELDAYFNEARSWETNKTQELLKSRKTAWIVACVSAFTTVAAVFSLAALTPLKQVEPYVIRVDNATGIVDIVEGLGDGKTNYDEAINKYFTQLYVRYREGYSAELAEEYYGYVGIMSNQLEQQKYAEWFNPKNKDSPIAVYGEYAKVKIHIKSTSFIKDNVALIRYSKNVERGTDKAQSSHWAATVVFKYSSTKMSEKDRAINPLGFQVTEYRNDPDTVTESPVTNNPSQIIKDPAYIAPVIVPAIKQN